MNRDGTACKRSWMNQERFLFYPGLCLFRRVQKCLCLDSRILTMGIWLMLYFCLDGQTSSWKFSFREICLSEDLRLWSCLIFREFCSDWWFWFLLGERNQPIRVFDRKVWIMTCWWWTSTDCLVELTSDLNEIWRIIELVIWDLTQWIKKRSREWNS